MIFAGIIITAIIAYLLGSINSFDNSSQNF